MLHSARQGPNTGRGSLEAGTDICRSRRYVIACVTEGLVVFSNTLLCVSGIQDLSDMLMGVPLEEGMDHIELRFIPRGLMTGGIFCIGASCSSGL